MFYLYVKTHNVTGLKYLGHTKQDPFKYSGSGLRWQHHLKKYGNDVNTKIIGEYETRENLKESGTYYSKLWDVVKSKEWANLMIEDGITTGFSIIPKEARQKTSRIAGHTTKERNVGIFGLTKEQRAENCKKGGITSGTKNKQIKRGIFSLTKEQQTENAKKGGKISGKLTQINKTGIFGMPIGTGGRAAKGFVWYNNGLKTTRLNPNHHIPEGFSRGRLMIKAVHNGK